jgi:hypothetical protein
MDIEIGDISNYNDIDYLTKAKMMFVFNALNKGWKIQKKENRYIFTKKHNGKKEVLTDKYLKRFIETNISS